jgi:hypothetical protein
MLKDSVLVSCAFNKKALNLGFHEWLTDLV